MSNGGTKIVGNCVDLFLHNELLKYLLFSYVKNITDCFWLIFPQNTVTLSDSTAENINKSDNNPLKLCGRKLEILKCQIIAYFTYKSLYQHNYILRLLQLICSYVFMPLAFIMGVEWADCRVVAELIGLKTFLNEFVAYGVMGEYIKNRETGEGPTLSVGSNLKEVSLICQHLKSLCLSSCRLFSTIEQ